MTTVKKTLTRSLLLAALLVVVSDLQPVFGQVLPGIPESPFGVFPGLPNPVYPYLTPGDVTSGSMPSYANQYPNAGQNYGYGTRAYPVNPNFSIAPAYYGNPYPYGEVPSYTYVNPIFAPAPIVPSPIVERAPVPSPIVPSINVTPNAPWSPGTLNPNLYGVTPYGSAPETVIWGGESVRPYWFEPVVP